MPGRVELLQPLVALDAAGTSEHGPHSHAPLEGHEAVAWTGHRAGWPVSCIVVDLPFLRHRPIELPA
ncbi:hypothetical protein [Sphaerimonospora mesophila]|uniref:hypothetical protein n=1 Tax=Sphaerimonospora mesophila TaxID=37483 RepID=UPI0006E2A628